MYPELCAPSEQGKTEQVMYLKKSKKDGQATSRAMTAKICKGIDQRNSRKRKR